MKFNMVNVTICIIELRRSILLFLKMRVAFFVTAVPRFTFHIALLQCLITRFALFDPSYVLNDFFPPLGTFQYNDSNGSVLLSSFLYTAVCLRSSLLITTIL